MPSGEFIVYNTEDGRTEVQLRAVGGTVWLNQRQIADLFGKSVPTINEHIRTIYDDGEAAPEATIRKFRIVRTEGTRQVEREIEHYSLDLILAVGYRVRSTRGAQFRRWATTVLREYLIKGFAMNDARLKDPAGADYDPKAPIAQTFFAKIQKKLLYAVTGQTAAELVVARSDPAQQNMRLTSFKGARVRKGDVGIAKNYLTEPEIKRLNRLTTMFLDYAEDRAEHRQQLTMADWIDQTDRFLHFNEREVLRGPGRVSAAEATQISADRYVEFSERRQLVAESALDLAELEEVQAEIEKRR